MVSAEDLDARRAIIERSPDLRALQDRLRDRAIPVIERMPPLPEVKALLSADGGVCPADGAGLAFDPWSPERHRCPRCGAEHQGERHHRHWARFQHLWAAERAAHLACLAALSDDDAAARRAGEILGWYGERYLAFPNRDNVLGPSRLFFSTYLESIWVTRFLSAAVLLREAGRLPVDIEAAVSSVADEAANLIGEFDEGFSNRQTWHSAALLAIAVWFEDEQLADGAIQGPTGLLAHLARGFGPDGVWYEGENYHLFALQGLLTGAGWGRLAGVDLFGAEEPAERLGLALLAPARTALPDGTFPARKDARFGVSLAQPMYLELWEAGRTWLDPASDVAAALGRWLAWVYRRPAPPARGFDSYLHDAGVEAPSERTRADLSWWMLLEMDPDPLPAEEGWSPESALFESQGLAVLRSEDDARYVSLECGPVGGGHGHPDRLHLTLHAHGVHWLPDPGTGSYVARDLFWYRSTLAHNAPRLDGISQPLGDASCEAYEAGEGWSWIRGRYRQATRTVVSGSRYVLDVVEWASDGPHLLELPWHVAGTAIVTTPEDGDWQSAVLDEEHVSLPERWVGGEGDLVRIESRLVEDAPSAGARLVMHLHGADELVRAMGPGLPDRGAPAPFFLLRARGTHVRLVSVLEPVADGADPWVQAVRVEGDLVEVEHGGGTDRHGPLHDGWQVEGPDGAHLGGLRPAPLEDRPLFTAPRPTPASATVPWTAVTLPLDASSGDPHVGSRLHLDHEDQYRRSEEAYLGADEFSAQAWVAWSESGLLLSVEVTKPELVFRAQDAPPLRLDNEVEDIHSDGLQLYCRLEEQPAAGWLVVPVVGGGLRVRPVSDLAGKADAIHGGWARTDAGYRIDLSVHPEGWELLAAGDRIGFDLIVNEMLSGRERRAGQLVWSGGGGWVWLRGDRQDPARFGILELA